MTDYSDPANNRRAPTETGWHLKKEVNLTIIISIVGIAIACVTAWSDLKRDIELIKADQATLHRADGVASEQLRDAISTFFSQLARIDDKLQRLIERNE